MENKDFDWKTALADVFAAYVNQQTLEEAAELMASASSVNERFHRECIHTLDSGIAAADSEDVSVIACINKSGYFVNATDQAAKLLRSFRELYIKAYADEMIRIGRSI